MAMIHIDLIELAVSDSLLMVWSPRGNRGHGVKDREKEVNVFLVYSMMLNSRMCQDGGQPVFSIML